MCKAAFTNMVIESGFKLSITAHFKFYQLILPFIFRLTKNTHTTYTTYTTRLGAIGENSKVFPRFLLIYSQKTKLKIQRSATYRIYDRYRPPHLVVVRDWH